LNWPERAAPLPDDLCIALEASNYPFPSSVGRPMRIGKDFINSVIGPLPRALSAEDVAPPAF
jgi:hypothetical protein